MAIQQAHVYRCSVFLKSKLQIATQRGGELINVIAPNPAAAAVVVQTLFGSDLQRMGAPVLAVDNAYTTMTGS